MTAARCSRSLTDVLREAIEIGRLEKMLDPTKPLHITLPKGRFRFAHDGPGPISLAEVFRTSWPKDAA